MSLPRYSEYKDSGVEWLGEVPAHWSVAALNYRYEVQLGKMLDEKRITGEHLAPYLRNVDVQWDRVNVDDLPQMDFSGHDLERYGLRTGDLLVCEGGEVGRSAIWSGLLDECFYQKALHRLRARQAATDQPRFQMYLLRAAADRGIFIAAEGKSTIPHLTAEALRRYRLAYPPLEEQAAITAFLDRETAKIDALVAEQERLIELLKEKRQAVISHAVTKGLDPDAPMKDSGVEWLGEVPGHWDVMPLKWLTEPSRPIMYGIVLPGPDVGEGVPILKGGNVRRERLRLEVLARTTAEIEAPYARARLRANDLVYSIRGTIGDCEIVPEELEGCNITQDVARIAPAEGIDSQWLRLSLLCEPVAEDLACGSLGAAVRGINIFDLKRARIPVPPAHERSEIAAHLVDEVARLERLGDAAAYTVELLRERRAALISAAVTGQIDVRGVTLAQ